MNPSTQITQPDNWPLGMSINAAIPQPFDKMKEAGVACMELTFQTLDIFDPQVQQRCEQLIREAREQGISLWTVHIPYGDEWDPSLLDAGARSNVLKRIVHVMKLAQEWGADKLILHPSYEPVPPEDRSARLQHCRDSIRLLSKEAQAYGVQLAVECLPRTCLGNTAEEIRYLVEDLPGIGVCVDVNHLFKEEPAAFIRELGDRIITTHISDNDGEDERHWMPGEGIIDFNDVLRALGEAAYSGAFLYETRMVPPDVVGLNWAMLRRGGETAQ